MLINATPHSIIILAKSGVIQDPKTKVFTANCQEIEIIKIIEPSGILPRVSMNEIENESIEEIPVKQIIVGEIEGLPNYEEGTYYIVSSLVAQAGKQHGRNDLLVPGALVRDAQNPSKVLGCLFLVS